jgi:hypothetical protein
MNRNCEGPRVVDDIWMRCKVDEQDIHDEYTGVLWRTWWLTLLMAQRSENFDPNRFEYNQIGLRN